MIPEFVGRLPLISAMHSLSEDALLNILTGPKNAIVKQYKRLFRMEGVELEFEETSLEGGCSEGDRNAAPAHVRCGQSSKKS